MTMWQRNELKPVRCHSAMMGGSAGTAPYTPLNGTRGWMESLPLDADSDHPAATPLSLPLGGAPPKESASFANPLMRTDASAMASCKFATI